MAKRKYRPIPPFTENDKERFWKKVDKTGDPDECWLWIASVKKSGYGQFRIDGRPVLAHRVAYFLGHGKDPGKKCVCHKCDTPLCANPNHLWRGSHAENIRDSVSKGRFTNHPWRSHPELVRLGERNGFSKLKETEVIEIRALYATGLFSHRKLAVKFGVERSSIWRIVSQKSWRHVV